MDEYQTKLKKAIEQQNFKGTYDLHIRSPLLEEAHLPKQSKDEKKNTTLSIRIPPFVRSVLDEIAEQEDTTISNLILSAMTYAVRKHIDTAEARKIYLDRMIKEREALATRPAPDEAMKAILQELRKTKTDKE